MRRALLLALLAQTACWSEQKFREQCFASGHCADVSDGGGPGGGGGAIGGGGGAAGGGGGATGGGGGGAIGGGGGGGEIDAGTDGGGGEVDAGTDGGGGEVDGGTDGGGFLSDGGALTWAQVAAELFPATEMDAGFTVEFAPSGVPQHQWAGAVLTPTGDVICIPYAGTRALKISRSRAISSISIPMGYGWEGGVLLADGGVLGLPFDQPYFVSISQTTGELLDAGLPRPGADLTPYFEGGVITLSQKVLLAPSANVQPAVYDPATQQLTLFDAGMPPVNRMDTFYSGGILLADGESALMIPRSSERMLLVTPTSASLVGPNNLHGHAGGLLLANGSAVLMPTNGAAEFVIWSQATNIVTPSGISRDGYFSAAWSTNGYGYAIQTDGPSNNLQIAIIDRTGRFVGEVPVPPDAGFSQNSHYGLVTREDGIIVGCPYSYGKDVIFIVPNEARTVDIRVVTSPWLNKW